MPESHRAFVDGGIHAGGMVRDPEGRVISQAWIQITDQDRVLEAKTDQQGCFDLFRLVAPGKRDYQLAAGAPGFKSVTTKVSSAEDNHLAVTLQPEASASGSVVNHLAEDPCEASRR